MAQMDIHFLNFPLVPILKHLFYKDLLFLIYTNEYFHFLFFSPMF